MFISLKYAVKHVVNKEVNIVRLDYITFFDFFFHFTCYLKALKLKITYSPHQTTKEIA